jgi:hypothetical protein
MMEELNASSSASGKSVAALVFHDVRRAVPSIAQVYVFTRKRRKRKGAARVRLWVGVIATEGGPGEVSDGAASPGNPYNLGLDGMKGFRAPAHFFGFLCLSEILIQRGNI